MLSREEAPCYHQGQSRQVEKNTSTIHAAVGSNALECANSHIQDHGAAFGRPKGLTVQENRREIESGPLPIDRNKET